MRTHPRVGALAIGLAVVGAACGGTAAWLTPPIDRDGSPAAALPAARAREACGAGEPTVSWTPAQVYCCVGAPALSASAPRRDEPACAPPPVAAGQTAVLACVDGDPSAVIGVHRMTDGVVAIQTMRGTACGGMARNTMTAWWVTVPAGHPTAMVLCHVEDADCGGPPRP